MAFKLLIWFFIFLALYRFLFRVIFPFMHITRRTQDQLRQMRHEMDRMDQRNKASQNPKATNQRKQVEGDYIDYEEVK